MIDEFFCLRSEMYAFKCGNDSQIKMKCICKLQSKNIKFEELKNCLHGTDCQNECDKDTIRALNHNIYLQRIQNQLYLHLMINAVMKVIIKVNRGSDSIFFRFLCNPLI